MLTGRRVFDANEVSDTLAMVLMKEVDWTPLPSATPPAIRTLLRRCLEKDRKRRLPDIGAARLEIDEALAAPVPPMLTEVEAPRPNGQRLAWTVAALASVAALALAGLYFKETPPQSSSSIRFSVTPPEEMLFPGTGGQWLSPDGRRIAFRVARVNAGGLVRLAVRRFDEDEARILAGTEGVVTAFWSPDSRFLAFFAGGKLQKIDVTGSPPQVLCDLPSIASGGAGGTWNRDGIILFGLGESGSGLLRVSSGGGTPVPMTKPDATRNEALHRAPWFLPDGRHFLYLATSAAGASFAGHSVLVGSLDGDSPKPLMQADAQAVYAGGFVLFAREGNLLAQPFETRRLVTTGNSIVVARDVGVNIAAASPGF